MQIITRAEAKAQGLKRYFTGKPCKHGHTTFRQVVNGTCITCDIQHPCRKSEKRKLINKEKRRLGIIKQDPLKNEKARKKYWDDPEAARAEGRKHAKIARERHRERLNKETKEWRLKNIEHVKKYSSEYAKKYRATESGRAIKRVSSAKRRAASKLATPKWANHQKMKEIYAKLPDGMVVDHIIPLISDYVCGLHVETNFQYLTKSANSSKSNHWWPDMW